MRRRAEKIDQLRAAPKVEALVIGGGINGLSVWRELALQGVNAVLVEKNDFCSGASAAPSRMIHGGLRYLENGEFSLVRESLEERDRLLRNAPHFVSPLPTTIPVFDVLSGLLNGVSSFLGLGRKPGRRGAAVIKLGLGFYDIFTARRRAMPAHRFRSRRQTLETWPRLNPDIRCSATYYDAWISHPERLGAEMVSDIERDNPDAIALNYASAARGKSHPLVVTDGPSGEEIAVEARIIVNATGAWVDLTNAAVAPPDASPRKIIGGTKGSHLIVRNEQLMQALNGHMIYYENEDGRICIVFPYLGNVLVGSTDIRIDDPENVRCEEEEEEYILRALSFVFPDIRIAQQEIVYRFSGVRPLPFNDDAVTGRISRDHDCRFVEVAPDLPPALCMIGGKWTTFRAFGAQAADLALEKLGKPRTVDTGDMPIGGGRDFGAGEGAGERLARELAETWSLEPDHAARLVGRYGTTARAVAAFLAAEPDRPLAGAPDHTRREILWLVREENVVCLEDILLRRTALAMTGALTRAALDDVLDILGTEQSWNAERRTRERKDTLLRLKTLHGLDESALAARDENRRTECTSRKKSA